MLSTSCFFNTDCGEKDIQCIYLCFLNDTCALATASYFWLMMDVLEKYSILFVANMSHSRWFQSRISLSHFGREKQVLDGKNPTLLQGVCGHKWFRLTLLRSDPAFRMIDVILQDTLIYWRLINFDAKWLLMKPDLAVSVDVLKYSYPRLNKETLWRYMVLHYKDKTISRL